MLSLFWLKYSTIKTQLSKLLYLFTFLLIIQGNSYAQTGTWTQLADTSPHYSDGLMLLLTDGSVICHGYNGSGEGTLWDKLTPDNHGSYVNGTWSSIASMNHGRLFFSSQVLPSGKVYVAGGEYGGANTGEVYDPVANSWKVCGAVPNGVTLSDCNSEMLPDGMVLQSTSTHSDIFYNPASNTYTSAPSSIYDPPETSWLKLPDSSILFVGWGSKFSNRYIPSLDKWVEDDTLPVELFDQQGEEGPAFMLPNGKAIFFGATQYNAIYTPSGDTSPGTWTAAADFPIINGSYVGQTDAAGAMMVNGKILCAVSPVGINGNDGIAPIYFVEYDYPTNTFTQVKSIIPGFTGDSVPKTVDFQTNMLDLPDGNVLFTVDQSIYSHMYWIYSPGSSAIAAGKPTIDSIIPNGCPNYLLTGKLFNGITEGADFGDDWQMVTNYPIVRLTNGANVYYAKTTLWNRVGAIQTGSLEDSVVFTPPASLPAGIYSLVVTANGNPSDPVSFTMPAAAITPDSASICSGVSVNLTASGDITYTWSPSTNLSSTTGTIVTANPTVATTYTVTGIDADGCSTMDSVTVTVNSNPTVTIFAVPDTVCSGDSAVLIATGGNTYNWTPSTGLSASMGDSVKAAPGTATTYYVTGTGINGCSSLDSLTLSVQTCTAINQLSVNNDQLSIYPNPALGQFTIQLSNYQNGYTAEIYNVFGERVYQSVLSNSQNSINLTTQPAGMYYIKIMSGTESINRGIAIVK